MLQPVTDAVQDRTVTDLRPRRTERRAALEAAAHERRLHLKPRRIDRIAILCHRSARGGWLGTWRAWPSPILGTGRITRARCNGRSGGARSGYAATPRSSPAPPGDGTCQRWGLGHA